MSKAVCMIARKANTLLKSRVWENHKHGSVGVTMVTKLVIKI